MGDEDAAWGSARVGPPWSVLWPCGQTPPPGAKATLAQDHLALWQSHVLLHVVVELQHLVATLSLLLRDVKYALATKVHYFGEGGFLTRKANVSGRSVSLKLRGEDKMAVIEWPRSG